MMTNFNLTQNTTIRICSFIRMACRKRKIIEPNLKEHLAAAVHSVDEYFEVRNFEFVSVKSGQTSSFKTKM